MEEEKKTEREPKSLRRDQEMGQCSVCKHGLQSQAAGAQIPLLTGWLCGFGQVAECL